MLFAITTLWSQKRMILIIDAYNVLKAHERMNDISQRQRYHFIVQLVSYAKKKTILW